MVLGISLVFNALFIGLWIYGVRLDRKIKGQIKKNINKSADKQTKQILNNLYYDYGRFYYE